MYTCILNYVYMQDNDVYMQDNYVYMYRYLCIHARYNYVYMQDIYVYMQDNYVYMQDNYVYIIFFNSRSCDPRDMDKKLHTHKTIACSYLLVPFNRAI